MPARVAESESARGADSRRGRLARRAGGHRAAAWRQLDLVIHNQSDVHNHDDMQKARSLDGQSSRDFRIGFVGQPVGNTSPDAVPEFSAAQLRLTPRKRHTRYITNPAHQSGARRPQPPAAAVPTLAEPPADICRFLHTAPPQWLDLISLARQHRWFQELSARAHQPTACKHPAFAWRRRDDPRREPVTRTQVRAESDSAPRAGTGPRPGRDSDASTVTTPPGGRRSAARQALPAGPVGRESLRGISESTITRRPVGFDSDNINAEPCAKDQAPAAGSASRTHPRLGPPPRRPWCSP